MNCRETQELLPLYLTRELDAAPAQEINAHLAQCRACMDLCAAHSTLDANLARAFHSESAVTAPIEAAFRQQLLLETRRRWYGRLAVAAALLAAISGGYAVRKSKANPQWLADAARDHRLEVVEHQPRRWRTELTAIEEIANRFDLSGKSIQAMTPDGYKFEHAKICGLGGVAALHIVYADGARQVSVYVRKSAAEQSAFHSIMDGPESVASASAGKWTALAVTDGSPADCERLARRAAGFLRG